jgi:hypothetical protein
MKKALGTIFFAAVTLLAAEASAYMMALNEQLDHAIYSGHDPKLIVAGHIAATDIRPRPPVVEDYPADVSFRFTVTTVILGQQTYKGQTLVIPATAFEWPTGLLAFREGVRCALVLRTDWGDKRDGYYLCSVVPLSKETLRTAKDGEEAKRMLAAELLLELKNETSANRQRHLILQVSPILQKAESKALVPFLKSHDTWLRRAAIAGLTCATKETKYMTMAHQDIEQFVKTTGAFSTIKDLDGGRGDYVLYPLLFSHYSFLSVGWSREEDAEAPAYLPLFRLVARSKDAPEWVRWEHGARPLCRIGTREDARLLYEYCRDGEGREKKETPGDSSNRREIIVAISRILHLNWADSDFLAGEQEQLRKIAEALVKEGILNEGEVPRRPGFSANPGPASAR